MPHQCIFLCLGSLAPYTTSWELLDPMISTIRLSYPVEGTSSGTSSGEACIWHATLDVKSWTSLANRTSIIHPKTLLMGLMCQWTGYLENTSKHGPRALTWDPSLSDACKMLHGADGAGHCLPSLQLACYGICWGEVSILGQPLLGQGMENTSQKWPHFSCWKCHTCRPEVPPHCLWTSSRKTGTSWRLMFVSYRVQS